MPYFNVVNRNGQLIRGRSTSRSEMPPIWRMSMLVSRKPSINDGESVTRAARRRGGRRVVLRRCDGLRAGAAAGGPSFGVALAAFSISVLEQVHG